MKVCYIRKSSEVHEKKKNTFFLLSAHPGLGALLPLQPFLGLFQQRVKVQVLKPALGRRRVCVSVRV